MVHLTAHAMQAMLELGAAMGLLRVFQCATTARTAFALLLMFVPATQGGMDLLAQCACLTGSIQPISRLFQSIAVKLMLYVRRFRGISQILMS
jgi:hypothetical protein